MMYEYKCKDCGHEQIMNFSMKDENKDEVCEECGGVSRRRIFGGAATIWKTGGHSKARVDVSQARKQTTKICYNEKALDKQRELQHG